MAMKKELVNFYRCYNIYKITTDVGDVIYNGISDYVRDGFITVVGKSQQEVVLGINNVYRRMQMMNMCKRLARHR